MNYLRLIKALIYTICIISFTGGFFMLSNSSFAAQNPALVIVGFFSYGHLV